MLSLIPPAFGNAGREQLFEGIGLDEVSSEHVWFLQEPLAAANER